MKNIPQKTDVGFW